MKWRAIPASELGSSNARMVRVTRDDDAIEVVGALRSTIHAKPCVVVRGVNGDKEIEEHSLGLDHTVWIRDP